MEDDDHDKAKDYLDETKRWSAECAAYAEHMMKLQHKIPLLQGSPIPPPSNPPSASHPIIDLKPVELTADSNMSAFRAWKRQFEAYYVISNMRHLAPSTQHAFLLKNVDNILSRRVDHLRASVIKANPNVFRDSITSPPMSGGKVHIHLLPHAVPFRISVAMQADTPSLHSSC